MNIWFLASPQGYPFSFCVYTGKYMHSSKPLEKRVVNKVIEVLENYSNHAIFLTVFLVQQPFAEIWQEKAYEVPQLFTRTEHKTAH